MKARIWKVEVEGADHGMSIKSKSGVEPMRKFQGTLAAKWLADRDASKKYCSLSWEDGKLESTVWQESPKSTKSQPVSPKKKVKV